jgi:Protein of unknown function (DUF1360)
MIITAIILIALATARATWFIQQDVAFETWREKIYHKYPPLYLPLTTKPTVPHDTIELDGQTSYLITETKHASWIGRLIQCLYCLSGWISLNATIWTFLFINLAIGLLPLVWLASWWITVEVLARHHTIFK